MIQRLDSRKSCQRVSTPSYSRIPFPTIHYETISETHDKPLSAAPLLHELACGGRWRAEDGERAWYETKKERKQEKERKKPSKHIFKSTYVFNEFDIGREGDFIATASELGNVLA